MFIIRFICIGLLFVFLATGAGWHALAEDKKAEETAAAADVAEDKEMAKKAEEKASAERAAKEDELNELDLEAKKEANEALQSQQENARKIHERVKVFAKDLKPHELQHFYLIYNNHNLIGTIKTVREDVSRAVDRCGEENADMKSDLKARFKKWSKAVNPLVKEAEGSVNNLIVAQDYGKPKAIKKLLGKVDDLRSQTNALVEKIPVTTKDACEFLLKTMDKTQDQMASLLRETLVSYPQKFQSPPPGEEEAASDEL